VNCRIANKQSKLTQNKAIADTDGSAVNLVIESSVREQNVKAVGGH